ncbi:MAG: GlmU family protein [Chloroflexales bacterium]|nr:GlmU family protein [Chloroflexales bacterium]
MSILLFEGEGWRNFAPLAHTRPLFELRCGGFTLRERLIAFLERLAAQGKQRLAVHGLCRPHLMGYYGVYGGLGALLRESEPITLVNGRAVDLTWLPSLLDAPVGTVYEAQGVLLGARLSPALASAVLYYLREQQAGDALAELRRFVRVVEVDSKLLTYPWDLIAATGEQLVHDLPLFAARLPSYAATDPLVTVRGAPHVYVAPSARLDGPIVLDARDGPIFIDDKAHIEPFSFIQGPAYIGVGSLIASARIRGETSIGPTCRIGGEVEASVIQGFSNKHHDGFLGHSWLGEWVNIGAMTTNSDLKNNYGSVRMTLEGIGQFDTGTLKLGCFLADHVKLGIGLHLNGGTVISTASNIFGVHVAPKTVPPFTWGGEVFREYRIDGMINVARKVMQRRKQDLTAEYETMLRAVFAMTRDSRSELTGLLPRNGAATPTDSEAAALVRAEDQAIQAFEMVEQ